MMLFFSKKNYAKKTGTSIKTEYLTFAITFIILILGSRVAAVEYENYLYEQGFEGATNPVSFWTSNGTYSISEIGLTNAKAFSGANSYVIDVTFNTATYIYYSINQPNVPSEDTLNFTGHIYVEKLAGGSPYVGLGRNYYLPPTTYSGCMTYKTFETTDNERCFRYYG
jgi:hypothetical protein